MPNTFSLSMFESSPNKPLFYKKYYLFSSSTHLVILNFVFQQELCMQFSFSPRILHTSRRLFEAHTDYFLALW